MTRDEIEAHIAQIKEIRSRGEDIFSYTTWFNELVKYIEQQHQQERAVEQQITDYLRAETEAMSANTAYIVYRLVKDIKEGKHRK